MHGLVDETGGRYGYLRVLGRASSVMRGGRRRAAWACRCDCGEEVIVEGQRLRAGRHKACGRSGHYWRERGKRDTLANRHWSEYRSWRNMIERCGVNGDANYAGRGIKVCERWRLSFADFLADMGVKAGFELTIERIDNDGDYEPGNCRWATRSEQMRNTRRSLYVEHHGRRVLLLDLVEDLGLSCSVVRQRLKLGWSLPEALGEVARERMWRNVKMPQKGRDLEGRVFGRLKVMRLEGKGLHGREWLCECECGVRRVVRGDKLLVGNVRSCGGDVCRAVMTSEGWRQRARRLAEEF
jgi:hypothetical protein